MKLRKREEVDKERRSTRIVWERQEALTQGTRARKKRSFPKYVGEETMENWPWDNGTKVDDRGKKILRCIPVDFVYHMVFREKKINFNKKVITVYC